MGIQTEDKHCLYCGDKIKGRADKKFCDDQCRTAFNNRLKSDTNFMRNVNNALRKNRKILQDFVDATENGKCKISAKKLVEKGFNFSYHTHTYITKNGAVYHFCYEYGYLKLENDYYMLVKRND